MRLYPSLSALGVSFMAGNAYAVLHDRIRRTGDTTNEATLLKTAACAEVMPNSMANNYPLPQPFIRTKWNYNWDNRDPHYLVNPVAYEAADEKTRKQMLQEVTPKAKRNILLIRHGQYVLDERAKGYLSLTPLGREQATYIGQRLAKSGIKFDSLVTSTMVRAMETARLILDELPPIASTTDPLLEEGAPYPVEPPSPHWKPGDEVSTHLVVYLDGPSSQTLWAPALIAG